MKNIDSLRISSSSPPFDYVPFLTSMNHLQLRPHQVDASLKLMNNKLDLFYFYNLYVSKESLNLNKPIEKLLYIQLVIKLWQINLQLIFMPTVIFLTTCRNRNLRDKIDYLLKSSHT